MKPVTRTGEKNGETMDKTTAAVLQLVVEHDR